MYKGINVTVETAFQSSKVFEEGGPYVDLLYGTSIDAKKDVRLLNSGNLIEFNLLGEKFPIEPKTLFYDWIYLNALSQKSNLLEILTEYDSFTDIAFNPKKSINCQARSVAIAVSLYKKDIFYDALSDRELFKNTIYQVENKIEYGEQIALFD
jgi:type I restriction enzyme M protein